MWKDLSIGEKAALMRIAVDSGIYSINDIVNTYNEYAEGGVIETKNPEEKETVVIPITPRRTPFSTKKHSWESQKEYEERMKIYRKNKEIIDKQNKILLDTTGLTQNALDYLKFGAEKVLGVDSLLNYMFDKHNTNTVINSDATNSYANGGPLKSYKDFSTRLSKAWNNQDISKDDYDYQKYYNDNPDEAYRQLESIEHGGKGHFPDEGKSGIYKTSNHPTYPDLGSESWLDNDKIFNMSERQFNQGVDNIRDELNTDRVLDYLGSDLYYNNGSTKVMYDGAYILPSVTVTPKGNYTTLVPNELGTGWMYRDRAGRYNDFNYDYVNKFKDGGYKPSSSIKKQITNWEGSSMSTNRSFDAEARDFNNVLPQGATSKLTQQQLDGLYSYSYNVGAGNFKKRVSPVLQQYLTGHASLDDVKRSMWASKDSSLRGLRLRRQQEKNMLGGNYIAQGNDIMSNVNSTLFTHYFPSQNNQAIQDVDTEISPLNFGNVANIDLDDNTPTQEIWMPTFESSSNPTGLFKAIGLFNNIGIPNKYNINI